MLNALQLTIDRLASTLARSVVVDDEDFNTLYASTPFDDLDDALTRALIHRRPSPEGAEHLRALRLHSAHSSISVAASAQLEFRYDRLCIPLRSRLVVMGYLWVTTRDPLSSDELDVVMDAADAVTRLIVNFEQSVAAANLDVEAGFLGLLAPEPEERARAVTTLHDLGLFLRSQHFIAIAIDLPVEWAPLTGTSPRILLTRLLKRAVTMPALDAYMFAPMLPSTFMLIGYSRRPARSLTDTVITAILERLAADDPALSAVATIGIGDVVDRLEDSWLSYEQAGLAARVARRADVSSAYWTDRPLDAAAALFTPKLPDDLLLPPALRAATSIEAGVLDAVEAFLRRAGDATAAALDLDVHRGTIYYRLKRFTEATGLDLSDGLARYVVHGWLLSRAGTQD